jgi:hypothetical protein
MFDGNWRYKYTNKEIKIFDSPLKGVSHNLTIIKKENGFLGISRLDKDTSRHKFMKYIGDCKSLLEVNFDDEFNIISQIEHPIKNIDIDKTLKFEDYRLFTFKNSYFISVSYIDDNFNTKVAIIDKDYNYLGDIIIEKYNNVIWCGKKVIWEKNWLFFEKSNELYFIYTTSPRYIVYKCNNFDNLEFIKFIDIEFPFNNDIPNNEKYFTSHICSDISISTGGSTNPIFIKEKNVYLYFIHTKRGFKYKHYAILLNEKFIPIFFNNNAIIDGNFLINKSIFFIMSLIETENYIVISGGIEDKKKFVWELSKEKIFKKINL